MIGRGCGDFNDLAVQALNQRTIFGFRVDDDNVVVCGQRDLRDLALGGKGFAGAGDTENKAVTVEQLLSVCQNEIFGDCILPVVDAVPVADLLCLERHKHSEGFCGQRPQRVNAPHAERQRSS